MLVGISLGHCDMFCVYVGFYSQQNVATQAIDMQIIDNLLLKNLKILI